MQVTKVMMVSLLILSGCVPAAQFIVPEGHPASVESQELPAWSGPAILVQEEALKDEKPIQSEKPNGSTNHHMHGGH